MTDELTKEDCDEMERLIKRLGHAGNMQKQLSAAVSLARAHLEARESGEGLVAALREIGAQDGNATEDTRRACTAAADALAAKNREIERLRNLIKRLDACQIYVQGDPPAHWRRSHKLEAEVTRTALRKTHD